MTAAVGTPEVVTELGYVGLSVSDRDAWVDFAENMLALQVAEDSDAQTVYLRMDLWHHRIALHVDGQDDLAYLGWRVAGAPQLAALGERLESAGVVVKEASKAEAAERRVLGLIKLEDPAGNPTEIFFGPQVDNHRPFHPGRPMRGRFLTGGEGCGHLIVRQDDPDEAVKFYRLLGLVGDMEYKFQLPDGSVAGPVFMHVPGGRHHSIAFGLGPMAKRVNHLMMEYTDLADLGQAHDRVRAGNVDVALQLGQHANDQALTFYFANPSGWLCELGWGSRKPPVQQEHYVSDVFGHDNEKAGYGLDIPLR